MAVGYGPLSLWERVRAIGETPLPVKPSPPAPLPKGEGRLLQKTLRAAEERFSRRPFLVVVDAILGLALRNYLQQHLPFFATFFLAVFFLATFFTTFLAAFFFATVTPPSRVYCGPEG